MKVNQHVQDVNRYRAKPEAPGREQERMRGEAPHDSDHGIKLTIAPTKTHH